MQIRSLKETESSIKQQVFHIWSIVHHQRSIYGDFCTVSFIAWTRTAAVGCVGEERLIAGSDTCRSCEVTEGLRAREGRCPRSAQRRFVFRGGKVSESDFAFWETPLTSLVLLRDEVEGRVSILPSGTVSAGSSSAGSSNDSGPRLVQAMQGREVFNICTHTDKFIDFTRSIS